MNDIRAHHDTSAATPVPAVRVPTEDEDLRRWCDDLVFELRLRDIPGARIGDEVATVVSHCQETGENATESFGAPRDYADSLDFGANTEGRTGVVDILRAGLSTYLGLAGFALAQVASPFATSHGWVDIRAGHLVALTAFLLAGVMLVRWFAPLFRHVWRFVLLYAAAFATVVLATILLRQPVFSLPALLVQGAALLLLISSVVAAYVMEPEDDRVIDPRDGTDRYAGTRLQSAHRVGRVLRPWIWPLVTAALLAIDLAARHTLGR